VARWRKRRARRKKNRSVQKENAVKSKPTGIRILRDFVNYGGPVLVVFAGNIGVSLDPTKFPGLKLTVDPKTIMTLAADLSLKLGAQPTGGTIATQAVYKAFDAVTEALNADANDLENVIGHDLEALLSTGYLPVSNNRSQSPLDDTAIVNLMNNGTTQLLLQLLAVRNAKSYQMEISLDGGKTWLAAGISTKSRPILLTGLIPGTTYTVRARAIGGSTGASDWTPARSIMCT
jgi:hypothetical protein